MNASSLSTQKKCFRRYLCTLGSIIYRQYHILPLLYMYHHLVVVLLCASFHVLFLFFVSFALYRSTTTSSSSYIRSFIFLHHHHHHHRYVLLLQVQQQLLLQLWQWCSGQSCSSCFIPSLTSRCNKRNMLLVPFVNIQLNQKQRYYHQSCYIIIGCFNTKMWL